MTAQISNGYVSFFSDVVHQVFQSEGGYLRGTCRTQNNLVGNTAYFPVIGAGIAHPRAYRSRVTPMNPSVSQVSVSPEDYVAADYVDKFEQFKVNWSQTQELMKVAIKAIQRQEDQFQIDALATSGTSNTISDGGTNLTYDKVLESQYFLNLIGVPEENRYFAIDAAGNQALMADDHFVNSDYTNKQLIDKKGTLNGMSFLGFNFIVLPQHIDSTTNQRFGLPKDGNVISAYAWQMDAVGMAYGERVTSNIAYIDDMLSTLVTTTISANAVAIDPTGIVECDYDITA